MEIIRHLEDIDNERYTVCGEVVNENNISFVEILCTCKKCLNSLIYVNFGDVSRKQLGIQCQYGSRYVDGVLDGWKNLGEGLRFKGKPDMYHSLRIHKNDVEEFVRRYNEHRKEIEKLF